MKKTKHLIQFGVLALILYFMLIPNSKAQLPYNDAAWIKNTSLSDEFTTLDTTSKWWTIKGVGGGAEYDSSSCLHLKGDTLEIKVDTIKPSSSWVLVKPSDWNTDSSLGVHYAYKGGGINSQSYAYKYGYLEINAKYPVGYYSLWNCFWLYNHSCSSPEYYNEIDIAEEAGLDSYNGNVGTNIVLNNPGECSNYGNQQTIDLNLSSAFHKYAVEWAPDRVIWYVDNIPVRSVYDATGNSIPNIPCKLYLPLEFTLGTHGFQQIGITFHLLIPPQPIGSKPPPPYILILIICIIIH